MLITYTLLSLFIFLYSILLGRWVGSATIIHTIYVSCGYLVFLMSISSSLSPLGDIKNITFKLVFLFFFLCYV